MESRIILDDISFRQISDDFGSPEPDTGSKTSYKTVATPIPDPQIPSASTVTASSTPTVDPSSYLVVSITSAPSSLASPTTPSSCTPTIIDGGFANFLQATTDGNGTSGDWSYSRDFTHRRMAVSGLTRATALLTLAMRPQTTQRSPTTPAMHSTTSNTSTSYLSALVYPTTSQGGCAYIVATRSTQRAVEL
jgi:hypothetical protein